MAIFNSYVKLPEGNREPPILDIIGQYLQIANVLDSVSMLIFIVWSKHPNCWDTLQENIENKHIQ